MDEEYKFLLENQLESSFKPQFKLEQSKPQFNLIGTKWVFKIKRKVDGFIEIYKTS